ncbi:MAG: hypothetical protein O7D31_08980 [Alphaproteobacteria bacterium]|nr:hypothetical protein [Alphaproteobacteria bacterium]
MQNLDQIDDGDDGTVFRDVIMLALLGFVTIVILLLPHLNPPVEANEPSQPPGNIIVELRWPDDVDADVDLWVEAPGDMPVGYSNKGGRIFNLLRDDLGNTNDATKLNYEVAYSRGIPAGEYTVNLHLYRSKNRYLPIPAVVAVGIKADRNAAVLPITTGNVELVRVGQEITVVRFAIDERGMLVPGSIHELQRDLRAARR